MQGKGFFIWKIEDCEGGDVNAIANLAKDAGLTHVVYKVADKTRSYNSKNAAALTQALRRENIAVWGWHHIGGQDPAGEAKMSIEQVRALDLDGLVIDAGSSYAATHDSALAYLSNLNRELLEKPLALSSFRFPSYHPDFPWRIFLDRCDLLMPQVFWEGAHNPAEQLKRAIREYRGLIANTPIIPIGSAFSAGGWVPQPDDIQAFLNTAVEKELAGVSIWEWSSARTLGLWDQAAAFEWRHTQPAKSFPEIYVASLNQHQAEKMLRLYAPEARHVTTERTVTGSVGIHEWYEKLLGELLPNAVFTLEGYSSAGDSVHITWQAVSAQGLVDNGNDTFILKSGEIVHHLTVFTITNR